MNPEELNHITPDQEAIERKKKKILRTKIIGYSAFFVVVTAVFWFFTYGSTDNLASSKLPVINYVRPFNFTTEDGKPFDNADVQGKVYVVNYFYTTCHGICPRMNNNMKKIYDEFKNEPDFMIVSHTCMPEVDSAPQLKHYADSMQVDTKKWVFVTGDKKALYDAARNSYMIDDGKNAVENIKDQFIHTQFFALVDKNGNVRGEIFDGLKDNEIQQLSDDIKLLLKERQGSRNNFSNNIFGNNL